MRRHPLVEFIQWLSILVLVSVTSDIYALVAFLLVSQIINSLKVRTIIFNILAGLIIVTINTLTVHRGTVFLFYINYNPITLESIVYGAVLAVRFITLFNIIISMGKKITTEKIVILVSYISPSLAVFLSQTIRSAYIYRDKLKEIWSYQKSSNSCETLWEKFWQGLKSLDKLVTVALENGLDQADSMLSRGYGTGKRTSYSPIRIMRDDVLWIISYVALLVVSIIRDPKSSYMPEIIINFDIVNLVVVLLVIVLLWREHYADSKYREERNRRKDNTGKCSV